MSNKKNIERLFQEKFKDFEATPPKHVWGAIETSLNEKNSKSRKVIPLWWQLGGAAAAIILLALLGNLFLFPSEVDIPSTQTITDKEIKQEVEKDTKDTNVVESNTEEAIVNTEASEEKGLPTSEKSIKTTNVIVTTSESNSSEVNDSTKNQKEYQSTVAETNGDGSRRPEYNKSLGGGAGNNIAGEESTVAQDAIANNLDTPDKLDKTEMEKSVVGDTNQSLAEASTNTNTDERDEVDENEDKPSIFEVVDAMNEEEAVAEVESVNRPKWAVSPNVAPIYYNSLSEGSPISRDFSNNSKEGKVNMSYGINVAYNVSKRLSIRSGVNSVNMSYATNDIEFAPVAIATSSSNDQLSNITFKSAENSIRVTNSKAPNFNDISEFESKSENISEGDINQKFGYLEVPMELKYRLIDRKLGLNVIGGFSSLFLTDNEVSLETNNLSNEVGEANNLNDLSFSTNIGLGLDYQLSNQFLLNLEPMFKYQLNTFSREDGGFSPYILGVYTGISFKF
ncbi:outer membrane beta-barrel protein [Galbibacter sp. BG1]|uniref:outer membrane beta-barrel protein n=1 Tax=Galbibacter sp. BG1 TaxID=1170699 RepID=UPI0015BEDD22|nr:outer membrane beta-barrel protein [Galbibacter sp. BG1]QLE01158.1 outer membrane beta-barrel protein [Galbibacter sp. BG1]